MSVCLVSLHYLCIWKKVRVSVYCAKWIHAHRRCT